MSRILDYSAGYPGARAVREAGYAGVIRYLRKEGSSSVKPITAVEYRDMIDNGLEVAFVYQHVSRSRVKEGDAAGRHDGEWALARYTEVTKGELGPRAIYFAADYDAPAQDFPAIAQYMAGAADAVGKWRMGTYGKWALLDHLFSREIITYGWQTYAWSPGHNKNPKTFHPRANLFQQLAQVTVGGIACDVNEVLAEDYGQFPSPSLPQPVIVQQQEEEEMKTYFVKGDSKEKMPAPHDTVAYGDLVFLVEATADGLKRRHIQADELRASGVSPATVSHKWLDPIPCPAGLFPWENAGGGPVPGEPE